MLGCDNGVGLMDGGWLWWSWRFGEKQLGLPRRKRVKREYYEF